MTGKVLFYYKDVCLLPPVRNFLRGMCLAMVKSCDFFNAEKFPCVVYQNEQIPFPQQEWLAEILSSQQLEERMQLVETFIAELSTLIRQQPPPENWKQWADYALTYVSNALIGQSSDYSKDITQRWEEQYGAPHVFAVQGLKTVNQINLGETAVYKKLFDQAASGVKSIDHAIATLLHVLPEDAEKILDIGAGPGYVNRHIPAYYDVLAMDLDEEILCQNVRPWCVGDVLDIPLLEQSVDLVIACDMIEHIEKEKLEQALMEVQRVSKKYIYIQVPYQEDFQESLAQCANCAKVWHVNFHKSEFSLSKLTELLNDEWEIKSINFTGEVQNLIQPSKEYRFLKEHDIASHMVEGWECPYCKGNSQLVGAPYFRLAQAVAEERNIRTTTLSRYSEVGVLWIRKPLVMPEGKQQQTLYKSWEGQCAVADFSYPMPLANVYTGTEQIPTVFLSNCTLDVQLSGTLFSKNVSASSAWVGIVFPFSLASADGFQICGTLKEDSCLHICALDVRNREITLKELSLPTGDFLEYVELPLEAKLSHAYCKIYFESDELYLQCVELKINQRVEYTTFCSENGSSHLQIHQGDRTYRWFLPEKQPVYFHRHDKNWLPESDERGKIKVKDVLDYTLHIQSYLNEQLKQKEELCEQFKKSQEASDQTIQALSQRLKESRERFDSLDIQLHQAMEIHQTVSLLKAQLQQALETNRVIPLLEAQLQQALETNRVIPLLEAQLQQAQDDLQLLACLESRIACLTEIIMQYEVVFSLQESLLILPSRGPSLGSRIKQRCLHILRSSLRFSKIAIRKVPYLYEVLVRLGVKRLYQRFKLIIKEGENYG